MLTSVYMVPLVINPNDSNTSLAREWLTDRPGSVGVPPWGLSGFHCLALRILGLISRRIYAALGEEVSLIS